MLPVARRRTFRPQIYTVPNFLPVLFQALMENQSQQDITQVCLEIKNMLLEKNRKYGDSALKPVRIFSKASTLEQLKVRLDDKLSRLQNVQDDEDEDVISDLVGYLILFKVAQMQQRRADNFIIL
jgi:hypothetical protein